jgi:transposase
VYVQDETYTREKLKELCQSDPEAIINLIEYLMKTMTLLNERVTQLEQQLKQDSHNSSKPPSSDGMKRTISSTRIKSNRSSGGQQGHTGSTLAMTKTPDKIIPHTVAQCPCGCSLEKVPLRRRHKRQVIDIPTPTIEYTEHQSQEKQCPRCGKIISAPFPEGVEKVVQYGVNIKSLALSLMQYQLIPLKRTQELLKDIFTIAISQGTLQNWTQELHKKVEPAEKEIVRQLKQADIVHADETGIFCKNKLHWVHVASTSGLTYLQMHNKRGSEAIDDIGLISSFKGRLIHDFWSAYFKYDIEHGMCNAHLIRELTAAYENDKQDWAIKMKDLLLRIDKRVETTKMKNESSLSWQTCQYYRQQYKALLTIAKSLNPHQNSPPGRRGKPKQTKVRNLIERMSDYQDEVLAFMEDFRVPFTNNQAERDFRMMKVKQKISGTFRSREGGDAFCRIRAYISTACKNAYSAFDAIRMALNNNPFIPMNIYAV